VFDFNLSQIFMRAIFSDTLTQGKNKMLHNRYETPIVILIAYNDTTPVVIGTTTVNSNARIETQHPYRNEIAHIEIKMPLRNQIAHTEIKTPTFLTRKCPS